MRAGEDEVTFTFRGVRGILEFAPRRQLVPRHRDST